MNDCSCGYQRHLGLRRKSSCRSSLAIEYTVLNRPAGATMGMTDGLAATAIAGLGIIKGGLMSRRLLPLAVVMMGGLGGAAGRWSLGLL